MTELWPVHETVDKYALLAHSSGWCFKYGTSQHHSESTKKTATALSRFSSKRTILSTAEAATESAPYYCTVCSSLPGINSLLLSLWDLLTHTRRSGFLLFLAQKTIPMGTAYAVWTGIGAAGAFLVGVLFMNDPSTLGRWLGVFLIVSGVVVLKLSSGH